MLISRHFVLGRLKMLGFLDELETIGGGAQSLYLPSGLSLTGVEGLLQKVLGADNVSPEVAKLAVGSGTGVVIFWSVPRKYLVLPPFPVKEKYLTFGYDVEPLRFLLQQDFRLALMLVRMGAFAVGVCQGEELITSKVGTGLVHARHKKGGSSQRRFERHRGKQVEQFLERVCRHTQERLGPYVQALDYVVYGGAWTTILALQRQCPFLHKFDGRTLPPLLDIPEPRQRVLEAAIARVWSSKLIEWSEY